MLLMFSRLSLCVCLSACSVWALNFWKPLRRNFTFCVHCSGTSSEYLGHLCISRSLGQDQCLRSRNQVCLFCRGSNFWISWAMNFIFGMQVHAHFNIWVKVEYQGHGHGHGRMSVTKYTCVICLWLRDSLVLMLFLLMFVVYSHSHSS